MAAISMPTSAVASASASASAAASLSPSPSPSSSANTFNANGQQKSQSQTQGLAVAQTNGKAPMQVDSEAPTPQKSGDDNDDHKPVANPEVARKYEEAAALIGIRLVSKESAVFKRENDPRLDFLKDHHHFMNEIKQPFKLRRIGGGELNIYALYKAVLDRGGLQSVVFNRAFKMVAKTLQLPKTCTSAAFILRSEYEKLLYSYEQKHVLGLDVKEVPPFAQSDRRKSLPANRPSSLRIRQYNQNQNTAAASAFDSFSAPQPPSLTNTTSTNNNARAGNANGLNPTSSSTVAAHSLQPPSNTNSIMNTNAVTSGAASGTRSRRQAAQAVSNAVAAAAVTDDPFEYPYIPKRSSRGIDERNLDLHEEQLVEDEMYHLNEGAPHPHPIFIPGQPAERERVVHALQSPLYEDISWALGTLNALSFDSRNILTISDFSGLLDALHVILQRYMEDVLCKRLYGVSAGGEEDDAGHNAPKLSYMSALDVNVAGDNTVRRNNTGVVSRLNSELSNSMIENSWRNSSLQRYNNLFNVVDPIAVDREQCAVVAGNILRNMSFYDRNAISLANCIPIMSISARMIEHIGVVANLRDSLMDMWINVSPYLDANPGRAGHAVLKCCIRLLDPFKEGADMARFTNCGEVLARLAASPERNERAMTQMFDVMLPRLVDMLGGRQRKYVNAGLAALCNLTAFDWPARDEIARVPRALDRLVVMLQDGELAPRAAVTLLNLAESPSNRSVLMVFERRLAEFALTASPAADTVCSILFALEYD